MARISMLEGYSSMGGFADALTPADAQTFDVAARATVKDLRNARLWMLTKIYAYPFATQTTKDGLASTAGTWQAVTDRLEKNITAVLNGEEDPKNWLAAAKTVGQGIDSISQMIGEENYFKFVQDRLDDVAKKIELLGKNLEQGLDQAISWSKYLLPGLLIGGAAILLMNLNSATKRRG